MDRAVRFYNGVPPVAVFASAGGSPLVIDINTSVAYWLTSDNVVTDAGGLWDSAVTYASGTVGEELTYLDASVNILAGTPNQVTVDSSVIGTLTLSLPQSIATTSTPNFTGLVGTTTNGNAAAGVIGEYIESVVPVASAVSIAASATATDITSITLTAGDWDVEGTVVYVMNGAVTISAVLAGTSLASATLPLATLSATQTRPSTAPAAGLNPGVVSPLRRVSISANTTVYLIAFAVFGASTLTAFGQIRARRIR